MATTAVSWPGESHGQRSLAGYSPWGHKESDTTKHTQAGMLRSKFFPGRAALVLSSKSQHLPIASPSQKQGRQSLAAWGPHHTAVTN